MLYSRDRTSLRAESSLVKVYIVYVSRYNGTIISLEFAGAHDTFVHPFGSNCEFRMRFYTTLEKGRFV